MNSIFQQSRHNLVMLALLFLVFGVTACGEPVETLEINEQPMHEAFDDHFLIGGALSRAQIYGDGRGVPEQTVRADRRGYFMTQKIIPDPLSLQLSAHHFNAITSENVFKWEEVHPLPGQYDFDATDRFVDFAEANDMFITGHTLVWHNQTPRWVYYDDEGNQLDRDALLERMRDHIHTVVGRYKGRVQSWDVVNEVILGDGSFRESTWYEIIGEDFVAKAFEFAHEADPDAKLYYNDYSMENPEKRAGIIKMIQQMIDDGVPIHGVGTQSHFNVHYFPGAEAIEESIIDLAELGLDVMVTEIDMNVLEGTDGPNLGPYVDGLPPEMEQKHADRYREAFEVYVKHSDVIGRVTFWGVGDDQSWMNYLPFERVNYPMIFDRDLQPKPAFHAIMDLVND